MLKDNIKKRRKQLNLTLLEVAQSIGVTEATLQRYESGAIKNIPYDKIEALSYALKTTPQKLMGWDDDNDIFSIPGIMPLPKTKKRPRLGVIACGEPILADENIEDYDNVPENITCDFTLICSGDSMTGARIKDGDVVYIREQPIVENGEIAACLISGEFDDRATLKRFYKYDDRVVLQAENPKYAPFVYIKEEMNRVRVLGKAVGFTSVIDSTSNLII